MTLFDTWRKRGATAPPKPYTPAPYVYESQLFSIVADRKADERNERHEQIQRALEKEFGFRVHNLYEYEHHVWTSGSVWWYTNPYGMGGLFWSPIESSNGADFKRVSETIDELYAHLAAIQRLG